MNIINEALDYLDMEEQIGYKITVDEYAAKMGPDKDIVTLTFTVFSKMAANDLVTWLERGYEWVLDASISDGELEPGKWLVFVELDRRSKVPDRIITLLDDLKTLTGIELKDWKIDIEGDEVPAQEDVIREKMILNPNEYEEKRELENKEKEENMNEMRNLAGLEPKPIYNNDDEYIRNLKALARI